MKAFILGFKLFIKKPFANTVLAIELAIVALTVVVAGNMYQYSQCCLNAFQNSKNRILYCANPTPGEDAASQQKYLSTLQAVQKKYSYVKGFSDIDSSLIVYNKEKLENEEAYTGADGSDVILFDDETISAFRFPVSKGQWLPSDLVNGKIPCVIGGVYAKLYKVGDIIKGYSFAKQGDGIVKVPDLSVVGILALPQQSLDTGFWGSQLSKLKASSYFKDMTNHEMFMIVPGKLFNGAEMNQFSHAGAFLYLDKSCTQMQIDEIRNMLTRGYTELDTEMITAEKKEIGQTLGIMMPFLIVLFLVIFSGIISVCMLTTMKNMQTFNVYYLTGCPLYKIMLIMLWHVLCYFILSGILFAALLYSARHMVSRLRMLEAYFILQANNFISIGIVCVVVLVFSLIIPFVSIKKNNLSGLLKKYK